MSGPLLGMYSTFMMAPSHESVSLSESQKNMDIVPLVSGVET
jgi:hypothetical protein